MSDLTTTSSSLLEGLRDPQNHAAWERFDARYRPVIRRFAMRLRLSTADADDVAQEAIVAFVWAYRDGKYLKNKGPLRSWLFGVTQNKVIDLWRQRGRERKAADGTPGVVVLGRLEAEDRRLQIWDDEWEGAILRECTSQVRVEENGSTTWRAFELYVLEQKPPDEVAEALQTTKNAVFIAKHKICRRIQAIRRRIANEF